MAKKVLILLLIAIVLGTLVTGCAKTTPTNTYGNLKVSVFGVDHQPLNGAKVVSDSQPDGQLKATGLTDASGTVWFQNIIAGNYRFYISRFDYNQTRMNATVNSGQTTEIPVYLELTNRVTTTPTTNSSTITFSQLTADPASYNSQTITIEGFWFDGFETEVLAERLIPSSFAQGNFQPDGVKIWVYGGIPAEISQQLYLQPTIPPDIRLTTVKSN